MAQFEPSRILDNGMESENVQQYVEIGNNTYLGTKDGMKYALIPTSDNKFKLCEVPNDTLNTSKSPWYASLQDESRNESPVPQSTGCRAIKIAVKKDCKGQGDESGNSMLSTPDSTSHFKSADCISEKITDLEGNQIHLDESLPLTYTTLVPKQEKIEDVTSVSYTLPQSSYFQVPQAQLTPISTKTTRLMKPRQRMQLMSSNSPYPCSPIPHATRGHRQRRPRNVWYQYTTPVLQSTPNSMSSSSLGSSIPVDTTRSSSITSCDESQVSLEYPRVPNNTPNSEEDSLGGKQKLLDLQQWIPQIHSRMDSYVQMDPRESHNEKERKRRLRIKNACQEMKSLLPCVCDKTDNATVFENAVHFITFMKETVGSDYDMIEKVDAPSLDHLGKQAQIPTLRISAVE
ncbi:BHLH domain-containing protein [Caerostris darwini]|uniref:BHLH domain-containing protein n=1 Tax=Caerostris darwini TaxID=1538125 RepID=A0AAV4PVP0_9ARAC|nr:BHLH domain-containing protein [Caerostris darwini]